MKLLRNLDFLSLVKSNTRKKKTSRKVLPPVNFGIPALPPIGGRPVIFIKYLPGVPDTDTQVQTLQQLPDVLPINGNQADDSPNDVPEMNKNVDSSSTEVTTAAPVSSDQLSLLFENPSVETHLFVDSPQSLLEEQSLTSVATKANLREGTKFVFGPTESEEKNEQDFDESVTSEGTLSKDQSKLSQLNIFQLPGTFFEADDDRDKENQERLHLIFLYS